MVVILKMDSNGNKWKISFYHLVKWERQALKKDPLCGEDLFLRNFCRCLTLVWKQLRDLRLCLGAGR